MFEEIDFYRWYNHNNKTILHYMENNIWYSKKGIFKKFGKDFVEVKRLNTPNTLFGIAAAKFLDIKQKDLFAKKIIENSTEKFEIEHPYDYSRDIVAARNISLCCYGRVKPAKIYFYVNK
jgi:hypothetical protein